MHNNYQRPRYLPPVDAIRANRAAVGARARARAHIESVELRAELRDYSTAVGAL